VVRTVVILIAFGLAGCEQVAPPGFDRMPAKLAPGDRCGASSSSYQSLVGRNKSYLSDMLLPTGARVIQPGMAVTADYSAERLNIDIGKDGRIARIWCG
jgi:hypothetical protein